MSALVLTVAIAPICASVDATVTALASAPHDTDAFTQGLIFHDGALYETTGRYGASRLRRVNPATGEVQQQVRLPARYFGEGVARVDNRLYWLTWKSGRAFVFDVDTFERLDSLSYAGQGWGLTWDGTHLIMSNGSATLQFRDPADFSVVSTLRVHENDRDVDDLNELEYIGGEIWANVWREDRILRIDADTGAVIASLDAVNLRQHLAQPSRAGALNGIAWDERNARVFVTGKNWPRIFVLDQP